MSIPSDKASSERLLRYARYHMAALKGDPLAAQLAEAAQVEVTALTQRHRSRLEAEDVSAEAEARLDRAEFELDSACRRVELEVLASVGKNRESPEYRATFPQGLSAFVAARGEVQVRQVQALVVSLRARIPNLGESRGPELEQLGAKLLEAERNGKTSVDALTTITVEEPSHARTWCVSCTRTAQRSACSTRKIGVESRASSLPARAKKASRRATSRRPRRPSKGLRERPSDPRAGRSGKSFAAPEWRLVVEP
jgi:hypothetical protein